ncbi:hypothetical protein [Gimibacter soli]|uniref:Iron transporter n=1 Tax=Gimibacter soli TaxID=3024400 RepID=A0AAF0BLC3_9PROT|nr:hypothetical protein [Gimibacter soli]WCL53972.1 hypothetical protein PH603_15650 [Gimibacter soli]
MAGVAASGREPAVGRRSAIWQVVLRTIAATGGNYLLTSLIAGMMARLLPLAPSEASMTATLSSFLIFALIAMWVFAARSVLRVYVLMAGWSALLGVVIWLSLQAGGRL